MDPSRALESKLEPNAWDITNQVLNSMSRKFRVVNIMSRDLATVASTYADRLREWRNSGGTPTSTFSETDGGLNEYAAKFERAHKQFGSLEHDQADLAYPTDKPYSRLEHGEDFTEPVSAQGPVASFKSEPDEPRKCSSAAPPIVTAFTSVNSAANGTPEQAEQSNSNIRLPHTTRLSYDPPTPLALHQSTPSQPSQPYSAPTLPYEQPHSYSHSSITPTLPPSAPHYGVQSPYAQTSGADQGQGSVSYNPQQLIDLERGGNLSINSNREFLPFYQNDQWGDGYSIDTMSSQSQYWVGPPAPYGTYTGQWSGQ